MLTRSLATAFVALGLASAASAQTTLLSDNFNGENGGVGAGVYSGFANWTAADVDLLAPGYFFQLCQAAGGSTPCVDMEGNGNGSLTTKTAYAVGPGSVTIQFDLAGDQRSGRNNGVTVSLVTTLGVSLFSESFALASDADFQTFTRAVSIPSAASVRLGFLSTGPADSFGMLLDNVSLVANSVTVPPTAPIPEPETWALFGVGLAAIGAIGRRRARRA